MATVATHLKPNLKSTYNLWKLLSNGDTVTCYYMNIPKRAYNEIYAARVDRSKKEAAQAIATWLQDDSRPHHCRYSIAKLGFNAIMAAYRSALKGHRLDTNSQLADDEWEKLRKRKNT